MIDDDLRWPGTSQSVIGSVRLSAHSEIPICFMCGAGYWARWSDASDKNHLRPSMNRLFPARSLVLLASAKRTPVADGALILRTCSVFSISLQPATRARSAPR